MCPASGVGTEVNLLAQGRLEVSLWRVRRGRWFAAIIVVGVATERERERRNAPCLGGRYRGAGSRDTEGVPLARGTLKVTLLAQGTLKVILLAQGTLRVSLLAQGTLKVTLLAQGTLKVILLAQGTLEVSLWRVRRGRWFAAIIIVVGVASERERER